MRIAFSLILVTTVVALLVVQVRDFQMRRTTVAHTDELPSTAIVFTGNFDRIDLALALFDQGRIERLFVSGVNSGAGITIENFTSQFHVSSSAMSGLTDGEIVLASEASTTLENALETACWLDNMAETEAIVLITDQSHMPRASLALERALPRSITIVRLSPEQSARVDHWRGTFVEFPKFVATAAVTLLPQHWWTQRSSWDCH